MENNEVNTEVFDENEAMTQKKSLKIDGVMVTYSDNGGRLISPPSSMLGETLTKWLEKNRTLLDTEFPKKPK